MSESKENSVLFSLKELAQYDAEEHSKAEKETQSTREQVIQKAETALKKVPVALASDEPPRVVLEGILGGSKEGTGLSWEDERRIQREVAEKARRDREQARMQEIQRRLEDEKMRQEELVQLREQRAAEIAQAQRIAELKARGLWQEPQANSANPPSMMQVLPKQHSKVFYLACGAATVAVTILGTALFLREPPPPPPAAVVEKVAPVVVKALEPAAEAPVELSEPELAQAQEAEKAKLEAEQKLARIKAKARAERDKNKSKEPKAASGIDEGDANIFSGSKR